MAKKKKKEEKEEVEETKTPTEDKKITSSFDYKKFINSNYDTPKAFIYYIISNKLKVKSKEDVEEIYKEYLEKGGNVNGNRTSNRNY